MECALRWTVALQKSAQTFRKTTAQERHQLQAVSRKAPEPQLSCYGALILMARFLRAAAGLHSSRDAVPGITLVATCEICGPVV